MRHLLGLAAGWLTGLIVISANLSGTEVHPLSLADIRIRDPFVYAHPETRTYYLYAQTGNARSPGKELGVQVYRSYDLQRWSEPRLVFEKPTNFWGGHEIWAPEMHHLGDHYYLFVTFNGRTGGRGTQILRASSPEGPFEVFSTEANTPDEECALDSTPWVETDGTRWLVYCHEWVQIGDGAMRAVRMKPDWSARMGASITLFHASEAPWVRPLNTPNRGTTNYVTDGPFLHRTRTGKLLMIWSSFGERGYALGIAESDNGRVDGKWTQHARPLFETDGGHGMLFRTFADQLKLVLHQPNSGGKERARLFSLVEKEHQLKLASDTGYAGYLFAHMLKADYGRLYYSISTNGLHWRLLNGGRRVFDDYRGHADLCRGHDGQFYLIGNREHNTDIVLWTSTNLVTWSRFCDYAPDVANGADFKSSVHYHGAPKIYFDETTGQYLITWHTPTLPGDPRDPEAHWRSMRTLYATSRDLTTFSPPRRLFAFDRATIDVIVRREGDRYFAILKDELWPTFEWPTGKTIRIASASTLTGPYGEPGPRLTPNFREAPTVIPCLDGSGWYLYYEQYPGVSYGLSTAPKLDGLWYDLYCKDYSVSDGARHGSMIPITQEELTALRKAFDP